MENMSDIKRNLQPIKFLFKSVGLTYQRFQLLKDFVPLVIKYNERRL